MNREPRLFRPDDSSDCEARLDALERFLDLVYETVERPRAMNEALSLLAALTGASSVLLLDGRQDRRLIAAAYGAAAQPLHGVRLPLHSDRLRTVPIAGGFELVLDHDNLSAAELAAVARLSPHLARALRLHERLPSGAAHAGDGVQGLDRLPLAVLLLDREGSPELLNRAARSLIAGSASLAIEEKRLVLRQAVPRALFENLLERVTAPPDAERRFVGGQIDMIDPVWGRVELLVSQFEATLDGHEVAAAVILSAPGAAPSAQQRLRDLHDLTAEEARAAIDLIAGRPPETGDGGESAKLIVALYRKLGTTRQGDLLRLLLRPSGVVFEQASRSRAT